MRITLSSLFALAVVAAIGLAEPPAQQPKPIPPLFPGTLRAVVAPALPEPPAQPAKPAVPLFEGLGKHARTVVAKPEAQKYFDQGLMFMFAFNHDEAIRAFRQATEIDPDCAMAYWGISLASGVNYNNPSFPPEKAKAAWAALQQARDKSKGESEANRALIEALAKRYADPLPEDTKPLERAYSAAMKEVWEKFPKDADIGSLYAESIMNLRPWELWTADGKPAEETPEILRALEAVRKLAPDHPLANHLYIHAVEASPEPGKADDAADRLRNAAPALGHLVHMPSHIDIRRGRWQEAVEANRLAIVADRAYQKVVPEQGFYRLYMAHNHHMLTFAAMMQGQSELAMKYIQEMGADVPKEWLAVKENAAIVDGFLAMPLEVLKRFGRWDDILKAPEPPEMFPIARAMRHYTRGVALAAKGKVAEARESQKEFREARKKVAEDAIFANNKAADLFAIGEDMLEGEILFREGKVKKAIELLRAAVEREDKLRYSEPPDWFVPCRHALGAILLHDGQAAEAEKVYREDLRRWPNNGWSLHGLAASLEAQGKKDEAAAVKKQFAEVWKRADVKITSSCYCVEK
jgi:tetratricopeptide (TPR) repeat protein